MLGERRASERGRSQWAYSSAVPAAAGGYMADIGAERDTEQEERGGVTQERQGIWRER